MKTKTLSIPMSSRSIKLVNDIAKTEQLTLQIEIETDSLGDSQIVITGNSCEVNLLDSIYNMVK